MTRYRYNNFEHFRKIGILTMFTLLTLLFAFFLLFSSFIFTTQAAVVRNNPLSDIGARDVFVLDVLIDTEGETINAIEGSMRILNSASSFEVRDISTAGSEIVLWPRKPSLSETGDIITFTGGVPGGISGKNILLFKVILFVSNVSELQIVGDDIQVFIHDGKGTAVATQTRFSPISIDQEKSTPFDAWQENISQDNTPPEIFEISLLQDKNLYNNSKYLSFNAFDIDSGISHYGVKEGNRDIVRTGETYVLANQSEQLSVSVTAYDIAGNARTIAYSLNEDTVNWVSIVLGVALGYVIILLIRYMLRHWRIRKL